LTQLDFFPLREFTSLADFHQLKGQMLSISERRFFITHKNFFNSPKNNEAIRIQHSSLVDEILGLRSRYVEEMLLAEARDFDPDGNHESWGPQLHGGVQSWVGLDLQTLQTPYSDILRSLVALKLRPYQHVVDLGAAYGRMGIVLGGLFIKNQFSGYEFVKARVDEGNRVFRELGLDNVRLIEQDLFDHNLLIPEADIYFMYDFGQLEHIGHTLGQLRALATKRPIKVVVRGKYTNSLIERNHHWITRRGSLKMSSECSIYAAYNRGIDAYDYVG
jgi:hypothetical protein